MRTTDSQDSTMTTKAEKPFIGFLKSAALFIAAWIAIKIALAVWGFWNEQQALADMTPTERAAYLYCGDDLACFIDRSAGGNACRENDYTCKFGGGASH